MRVQTGALVLTAPDEPPATALKSIEAVLMHAAHDLPVPPADADVLLHRIARAAFGDVVARMLRADDPAVRRDVNKQLLRGWGFLRAAGGAG